MVKTHWGREAHIWVGKFTIIGSDNCLSPGRRQAIIWTNAGTSFIEPLGRNFNKILIEIHTCSFKKMHLKMSSAIRRPFCLGLNVLLKYYSKAGIHYIQFIILTVCNQSWCASSDFIGSHHKDYSRLPIILVSYTTHKAQRRCRLHTISAGGLILLDHYNDAIMGAMASQITSLPSVYSTVYSGADQRKHQSSASLAFVRGIHRRPVNSPQKGPVTRKMFLFDDVIMSCSNAFWID